MNKDVSYQFVADDLGVSVASVRNWVKCGYLKLLSTGHIQAGSFDDFKRNIVGHQKLISRANKSLFDDHDHDELWASVAEALNKGQDMESLSNHYEEGLSNSFKNKEGVYYTPLNICDDFFQAIPFPISSKTFCDPCCGSGNFIISAIDAGFETKRIWGYDVDPIAVDIANARVYEKTGKYANIYVADFLETNEHKHKNPFDIIMTNPPWGKKITKRGKKLTKEIKLKIAEMVGAGKSIDTSSLFMLAAIQNVCEGGVVGMLLPDAFFNVMSFRDAREKILTNTLLEVVCYGSVFKGVMAKAKSLILQKKPFTAGLVSCRSGELNLQRTQESFIRNPNLIINDGVSTEEDEAIAKVFDIPHLTLKGNARWALGIVTGNNKRFISSKAKPGYVPVFAGKDLKIDGIAEPECFIPDDFSMYQQVAPLDIYNAESKLIYKFISSKLVFVHDTHKSYVLNSANMLIPSDALGIEHRLLAEYFSSEFVNWIFRSIFSTHKILRADLETIPIFKEFLFGKSHFDQAELINFIGLEKGNNGTFRIKK